MPMSVLLDLAEAALGLSVASTAAGARIAYAAAGGTVSVAIGAAGVAWEATRGLDPFALVGAVVALPRDAAHHATDANAIPADTGAIYRSESLKQPAARALHHPLRADGRARPELPGPPHHDRVHVGPLRAPAPSIHLPSPLLPLGSAPWRG